MEVTATEVTAEPTAPAATETTSEGQAPTATDSSEESFFDPKAVPDELLPAYKQMQRAFTQKTQEIAQHRNKVKAYDDFMRDPRTSVANMARQLGITMEQAQDVKESLKDWQPQTWQEVIDKAKQDAKAELMNELAPQLQPIYRELSEVKRSSTEKLLDENVPDWRQYEDRMSELLDKHPSLADDPVILANLAIPQDVRESRAMQAALKKLQSKAAASEVSQGSGIKASSQPAVPGRPTFAQAIDLARARLSGK